MPHDRVLLIPAARQQHWLAELFVVRSELEAWTNHSCISDQKRPLERSGTEGKLTVRWQRNQQTCPAQQQYKQTLTKLIIRVRLIVRGLKDLTVNGRSNLAGVSQRRDRRLVASIAVRSAWGICCPEISNTCFKESRVTIWFSGRRTLARTELCFVAVPTQTVTAGASVRILCVLR